MDMNFFLPLSPPNPGLRFRDLILGPFIHWYIHSYIYLRRCIYTYTYRLVEKAARHHIIFSTNERILLQVMTDPDVPGPSDPYLKEHLHWYQPIQILYLTLCTYTAGYIYIDYRHTYINHELTLCIELPIFQDSDRHSRHNRCVIW